MAGALGARGLFHCEFVFAFRSFLLPGDTYRATCRVCLRHHRARCTTQQDLCTGIYLLFLYSGEYCNSNCKRPIPAR